MNFGISKYEILYGLHPIRAALESKKRKLLELIINKDLYKKKNSMKL